MTSSSGCEGGTVCSWAARCGLREPRQIGNDDERVGSACGTTRRVLSGETDVELPPRLFGLAARFRRSGMVEQGSSAGEAIVADGVREQATMTDAHEALW